ncbi:RmlC-like cupin domain-containing protein [Podospora aff. communis PSN243]|uniref:RmlC-like cupin domain-containing protein n=1 Tax=Podospora aff. communis PSN243 TaxID=3040156 RepID=A0AAV9GQ13_9PEZI|nr:RmlC-like cupin domain-containing protein [Podospora aff. communis PSN243]
MFHKLTALLLCTLAATSLTAATPPPGKDPKPKPIHKRTAQEVIAKLNLAPNIERGYFVETFRDTENVTSATSANRSASTAIYYLLKGAVGHSRWHRVDAVEVWHYYAGAPLTLELARDDGSPVREEKLGPDVFSGERPQVVVGGGEWQRARSWGEWTLVGTTVAPGFEFEGFKMAEDGWEPNA